MPCRGAIASVAADAGRVAKLERRRRAGRPASKQGWVGGDSESWLDGHDYSPRGELRAHGLINFIELAHEVSAGRRTDLGMDGESMFIVWAPFSLVGSRPFSRTNTRPTFKTGPGRLPELGTPTGGERAPRTRRGSLRLAALAQTRGPPRPRQAGKAQQVWVARPADECHPVAELFAGSSRPSR